jgi:superfamily II DNA or RNA helicase
MRLVVQERLELEGLEPARPDHAVLIESLRQRFTYDNPVYRDARRFRRPCRHLPHTVDLFESSGPESVSLPRGGLAWVSRLLGPEVLPIQDRTAAPPADLPAFRGELRDYQAAAVDAAVAARDGVIQAPTGSGKTVIACALAARLQTRTLVIVHTSVLLEQTAEKFRQFLGIEPGIVGAGRDDWSDVTIAMVQTLQRRDIAPLRDAFGLVILDECHHCPAETFKSVVQRLSARWRIGLSATPTRKDRLHPVLFDVVGPIVCAVKPKTLVADGSIAPSEVVEVETAFKGAFRNNYGGLVSRLSKDPARNALIVQSVQAHRGERSLVLSDRVEHCRLLGAALALAGLPVAVLTGDLAKEVREQVLGRFVSGEITVLVATTALVGEGFDLPAIDTVFLTTPNGNVARTTQALGRALRPSAGKTSGRIVDFVDAQVPLLRNQARKRAGVYRGFEK